MSIQLEEDDEYVSLFKYSSFGRKIGFQCSMKDVQGCHLRKAHASAPISDSSSLKVPEESNLFWFACSAQDLRIQLDSKHITWNCKQGNRGIPHCHIEPIGSQPRRA